MRYFYFYVIFKCRGPEGTTRPRAPQGSVALPGPLSAPPQLPRPACPAPHLGPALAQLCVSADAWGWACPGGSGTSPGRQARLCHPMGPPRCHPAEALAGVLRVVMLVHVRPMEWRLFLSQLLVKPCWLRPGLQALAVTAFLQTGRDIL